MSISFRQRGKKRLWNYRVFDKNKKVIATNSGFRTKKEAEIEAIAIELKLKQGNVIDKTVSLYNLWEAWFESNILPTNKSETTFYKHKLRGQKIKDFFGDAPAMSIKASQYQTFINLYAEKVSANTVRRLNSEVRKVINFAKRDRIEIYDFTNGVIISGINNSKTKKEKSLQSLADYQKLLNFLVNCLDYKKSVIPYLLYIQLKTGLRFGEVLGLTWDCIDWRDKEIRTYRRYDSISYEWKPPKTETSVRSIPIDDATLTVLKKLKIEQKEIFNQKEIENREQFLFYNVHSGVPTNNSVNKHLRQLLQRLKIEPYNLSSTGIRHTYASILLAYGIDIWVVAENMGHKDIKQITETYGHLIKEKAENENNKIRNFLKTS
ncbi:TPA: site-specific integrase [Streptococcus equi subsp. zooepidemicus]|nr:site-specific integrase [Streptococcus equi subsp. zooepidemicus]HEL1176557.1 site-specific integrase [Streptococcus equi subsp. zooepidemicus]